MKKENHDARLLDACLVTALDLHTIGGMLMEEHATREALTEVSKQALRVGRLLKLASEDPQFPTEAGRKPRRALPVAPDRPKRPPPPNGAL